jgi:DNA-binding response OmpR family regulator
MTSLTNEADKKNAFDLGAADFIAKPINKEELLNRVTALIEKSEISL